MDKIDSNSALAPRDQSGVSAPTESGDATRNAILDAVVRCFAAQGWAGTNMSLISRETGMTRGKIQYYFPVLEEMKYAAIEYLYDSWRRAYFDRINPAGNIRASFDHGLDLLWDQSNDPLHIAMAQLNAAARTDEGLRSRLIKLQSDDEEKLDLATAATFPVLAAVGQDELRLCRHFATVFIDGLAAHRFPGNTAVWQARLIAMLKECLADFWARRGVVNLDSEGVADVATQTAAQPLRLDQADVDRRREALALLLQAAEILGGSVTNRD